MPFWDAYRASLKPADVEEPIDRWVHRPLGYVVAKLAFPTPISPDLVTVGSILFGVSGAAAIVCRFSFHMQLAGLLIFLSAVFDCADGQLARMRKSSSVFGRMLDGCADLIVAGAVVPATIYFLWLRYRSPVWLGGTVVGLAVVTVVTSSFHTTMYDHYKNVWLRFTTPTYKEGEDYASAAARWQAARPSLSLLQRAAFGVYLFYVRSQEDYVHKFDPFTVAAIGSLPPHTPANEAIYRARASEPFAALRSVFGFGSLMFGLALFNGIELPEVFLVVRLLVLNGLFYLRVRPMQRAASRVALAEMAALEGAPPAA